MKDIFIVQNALLWSAAMMKAVQISDDHNSTNV